MRSFWVWLLMLGGAWFFSLAHFMKDISEMPFHIIGSALFFALLFLCPLLRKKKAFLTSILSFVALIAVIVLWPVRDSSPNLFTLLVFSIIAGKAVYRLQLLQAAIVGGILLLGAITPYFYGYPVYPPVFLLFYALMLSVGFITYKRTLMSEEELLERNEALLSEYRRMKRRLATDQKLARQEERTQIAREIHDSVGHKLTALLMQLEVFRMEFSDHASEERIQALKKLAKDSLEETRSAVKTLKHEGVAGLSVVIGLIRKLEAESFIRVNFSIKQGALSMHLSNEQAIAVYRSVQEALTNMMRHSGVREVNIVFEAPGGIIFRFEVSNPIREIVVFHEGFGLKSMRERMEQAGGSVEIKQFDGKFVVRGTLPLHNQEGKIE